MSMNLLTENIYVLDDKTKESIREKFCISFIDTKKDGYREAIEEKEEYSDGYCYNGYLWDYIANVTVVEENYMKTKITKMNEVYALWDIHSSEKILIENYWKFKKDDIVKLKGDTLIEKLHLFPEDLYVFDNTYGWVMVFTHEYFDNKRYCLEAGNI